MKGTIRLKQQLQTIAQEDRNHYRIIRLNRPDSYNAINEHLLFDLSTALKMAQEDDSVRAVLLSGEGKAFCAGGDFETLKRYTKTNDGRFDQFVGRFHEVIEQIHHFSKPIVAYINGPAIGGGFSLAMACDMRIMSESAYLKTGYSSIALTPDGGWTELVARQIGVANAMELYLLDEKIDSITAQQLGLVNRVIESGNLTELEKVMDKVCLRSVDSFKSFKSLLNRSIGGNLTEVLGTEQIHISRAAFSPDFSEGIAAFKEGRAPVFNQTQESNVLLETA